MKAEPDKEVEDFIRKMIVEAGVDQPSDQFTASVMSKIKAAETRVPLTRYTPPIPKRLWVPIGLLVIGVCLILLIGNWNVDLPAIPIPFIEDIGNVLGSGVFQGDWILDNISIHQTYVYAVLMLSFFFYIQILYLRKRYA
jgi:hypothetical protein